MDVLQHGCCCLSAYSYLSVTLCSDKKWKMCFFTCDYIDSYDGTSKKNCNKLSAIFFHLAKLVSKYVSDHTTFSYIGEIKTRSADLNIMEVGSLANTLAKFTKHKIMSSILCIWASYLLKIKLVYSALIYTKAGLIIPSRSEKVIFLHRYSTFWRADYQLCDPFYFVPAPHMFCGISTLVAPIAPGTKSSSSQVS